MCVVSMVMDYYEPKFDKWITHPAFPYPATVVVTGTTILIDPPPIPATDDEKMGEVKKLLQEFKQALAAAKLVDKLTGQPDCEDPKKATLIERIELLELRMDKLEKLIGV